jgi:hypothetical protein
MYLDFPRVFCDVCGSDNIADTSEGYVCKDCGIVLEIQKFQYSRPYNTDIIQYAKGLGQTQIGNKMERFTSPHAKNLKRLNQYNNTRDHNKTVIDGARREISRILGALGLGDHGTIKEMCMLKFADIRSQLQPGTKFRNTEKLSAIILYFCSKVERVPINPASLIENSELSKKEFNAFLFQVSKFFPEYSNYRRQKFIVQRLLEVTEHFGLEMSFYHLSKKILFRFWEGINNTTDNVIAGLVSSIAILCAYKERVSVNAICKRLGIRMSTIQSQVKRKFFAQFSVVEFVSLVKSTDKLKEIMSRLGIIDSPKDDFQEIDPDDAVSDIIEIKFGNTVRVYNSQHDFDYYCYAIPGREESLDIIYVKIYGSPLIFEDEAPPNVSTENLLELEIFKYYTSKDPPRDTS